jgi:hypothetical protein
MLVGLVVMIAANILLVREVTASSQLVKELAKDGESFVENINMISLEYSILSVQMTYLWGILAFGIALFGIGLAVYFQRRSNYMSQVNLDGYIATTRLVLKAINRNYMVNDTQNEPKNVKGGNAQ